MSAPALDSRSELVYMGRIAEQVSILYLRSAQGYAADAANGAQAEAETMRARYKLAAMGRS